MATKIEQAATMLAEMKTMAGGDEAVLAMIEAKEQELKTLTIITPEDLKKAIATLKAEIDSKKEEDLDYDYFQSLDTKLQEIELRYDLLEEKDKKDILKEIKVLYISVSKLDEAYTRGSISSIESILETDKDYTEETQKKVEDIIDEVEESFVVIETMASYFGGLGKFSTKKWQKFTEKLTKKKRVVVLI